MKKCEECGFERNTNGNAKLCAPCDTKHRRSEKINEWISILEEFGYDIVNFTIDKGSHSKITVINRECEHAFTAKINNILSRKTICGECGPSKRPQKALKVYIEKYGRTYDITKWKDYLDYVRILSEKVYKENHKTMNPDGLKRTRVDLHPDAVNLDHIIPIIYGFKNGIEAEIMADPRNLRIINGRANLQKKQKLTEEAVDLLLILRPRP